MVAEEERQGRFSDRNVVSCEIFIILMRVFDVPAAKLMALVFEVGCPHG